jgi:DNA-binding NtrC family response regulator
MSNVGKVLLIEDDPGIVVSLRRVLAEEGHEVLVETRGDTGLARARDRSWDVVITDMRLPGLGGLEVIRELHAAKPRLPIILITGHGTTETAIEATKLGAYDYMLKPLEVPEFIELVGKAITSSRLMTEPVEVGAPGAARDALVGNSRVMQSIYKEIGRVASKLVNVLIRGETGTGKELIARALYQHSDRAKAPFIAINCAAIPETLLESELFGHERGAFTGAENRRIGRFEQAHHGTIFLDEIGDMAPGTQIKLMRVLQERCFQRLGGKETIPVDVRVLAATNRDLEAAIQHKQFREDLYYRLSVVVIQLPPLRQRKEDVPELVKYFLRKYAAELGVADPSIHAEAVDFLQAENWPGNVRELENVIRKVLLLAQGYTINLDHVRAALARTAAPIDTGHLSLREHVDELLAAAQRGEITDAHAQLLTAAEREIFSRAIDLAHGNQAKAARWLGVSRLTMREKLHQFGIHPAQENTTP